MLEIKNLKVKVWDSQILSWVDLKFETWKNYLLLWKNGSWKSSLANFLMWNPKYEYVSWEVLVENENLLELSPDLRAWKWIFLSFQNVPEISWVNLREYLRTIYNSSLKAKDINPITPFIFKRFIKKYLDELKIDESFLDRDLNVGFSGWEKRKIEILQAKLLNPKYIILDEIDSGLDLDAFKTVSNLVWELSNENNCIILITHQFKMTQYLNFDEVYVLKNWLVDKNWWINLLSEIEKNWFWE